MTDSKYFTTTKKGEIFELKSELNNDKKEKKKEAVKKVVWVCVQRAPRPIPQQLITRPFYGVLNLRSLPA